MFLSLPCFLFAVFCLRFPLFLLCFSVVFCLVFSLCLFFCVVFLACLLMTAFRLSWLLPLFPCSCHLFCLLCLPCCSLVFDHVFSLNWLYFLVVQWSGGDRSPLTCHRHCRWASCTTPALAPLSFAFPFPLPLSFAHRRSSELNRTRLHVDAPLCPQEIEDLLASVPEQRRADLRLHQSLF